jgi:hypothetical protein
MNTILLLHHNFDPLGLYFYKYFWQNQVSIIVRFPFIVEVVNPGWLFLGSFKKILGETEAASYSCK